MRVKKLFLLTQAESVGLVNYAEVDTKVDHQIKNKLMEILLMFYEHFHAYMRALSSKEELSVNGSWEVINYK